MNIKSILILLLLMGFLFSCDHKNKPPIKIGVIHSLSGTMALSEKGLVDAATLAIEEINAAGGVLGRQLLPVVVDGKSDWRLFASETERLITKEKVSVIFGCWTSACRKTIKPVVEKYNHLLFYPLQYEGLEQSPNIIYTGAAPNQQIIPSVHWAMENIGKRILLVGSDYIFPRTANMIIKDLLKFNNIEVLGEYYLPLGTTDVSKVIDEINRLKPDLILNTINGDTNIPFFKEIQKISKTVVLSYSIAEPEIKHIGKDLMTGHYAAWNYFQSINTSKNKKFVNAFKQRFGQDRVISDPMEATYVGIKLWMQAANMANSVTPNEVKAKLDRQSMAAPEGIISIDSLTHHLWKTVRIGRIRNDGQFDIVWSSEDPVRPTPFPFYRSKTDWNNYLKKLKHEKQK
jgi:urea transport system substrate-binding protein